MKKQLVTIVFSIVTALQLMAAAASNAQSRCEFSTLGPLASLYSYGDKGISPESGVVLDVGQYISGTIPAAALCKQWCDKKGYEYSYVKPPKFGNFGVYFQAQCNCANISGCQRACKVGGSGDALWDLAQLRTDVELKGSFVKGSCPAKDLSTLFPAALQCADFSTGANNCTGSKENGCATGSVCGMRPHGVAKWEISGDGKAFCVAEVIVSDPNAFISNASGSDIGLKLSAVYVDAESGVTKSIDKKITKLPPPIQPNLYRIELPIDAETIARSDGRWQRQCQLSNRLLNLDTGAVCGCPQGLFNLLKGYRRSSLFGYFGDPNDQARILDESGIELFRSRFTSEDLEAIYRRNAPRGVLESDHGMMSYCLRSALHVDKIDSSDSGTSWTTFGTPLFSNEAEIKAGMMEYYTILEQIKSTTTQYNAKIQEDTDAIAAFNALKVTNQFVQRSVAAAAQMSAAAITVRELSKIEQPYQLWTPGSTQATPWLMNAAVAYTKGQPLPALPVGVKITPKEFFDKICVDRNCYEPLDVVDAFLDARRYFSDTITRLSSFAPFLPAFKETNYYRAITADTVITDADVMMALVPPAVAALTAEKAKLTQRLNEMSKVHGYLLCPNSTTELPEGLLERVVSYLHTGGGDSIEAIDRRDMLVSDKQKLIELEFLRFKIDQRRDQFAINTGSEQLVGSTVITGAMPFAQGRIILMAFARARFLWLARSSMLEEIAGFANLVGEGLLGTKNIAKGKQLASIMLARVRDWKYSGQVVAATQAGTEGTVAMARILAGVSDGVAVTIGARKAIEVYNGICDPLLENNANFESYVQCVNGALEEVTTGYLTALSASGALVGLKKAIDHFSRSELSKDFRLAARQYMAAKPRDVAKMGDQLPEGVLQLTPYTLAAADVAQLSPAALNKRLNGLILPNTFDPANAKQAYAILLKNGWSVKGTTKEGHVVFRKGKYDLVMDPFSGPEETYAFFESDHFITTGELRIGMNLEGLFHEDIWRVARIKRGTPEFKRRLASLINGNIDHEIIHGLVDRHPIIKAGMTFNVSTFDGNRMHSYAILSELFSQARSNSVATKGLFQAAVLDLKNTYAELWLQKIDPATTAGQIKINELFAKAVGGSGANSTAYMRHWRVEQDPFQTLTGYGVPPGRDLTEEDIEELANTRFYKKYLVELFLQDYTAYYTSKTVPHSNAYSGENGILGMLLGVKGGIKVLLP